MSHDERNDNIISVHEFVLKHFDEIVKASKINHIKALKAAKKKLLYFDNQRARLRAKYKCTLPDYLENIDEVDLSKAKIDLDKHLNDLKSLTIDVSETYYTLAESNFLTLKVPYIEEVQTLQNPTNENIKKAVKWAVDNFVSSHNRSAESLAPHYGSYCWRYCNEITIESDLPDSAGEESSSSSSSSSSTLKRSQHFDHGRGGRNVRGHNHHYGGRSAQRPRSSY